MHIEFINPGFIWHDRIHAKAMWKMEKKTFEESEIEDVFFFD